MRKMPIVVLTGSALVGLTAAYFVTHTWRTCRTEMPPNVYVSADQQTLVELPEEPKPIREEAPIQLVSAPMSIPVLLPPEPSYRTTSTVALRPPTAVEEERKEEKKEWQEVAPAQELALGVANPEEAPPSPELIPMPTEVAANEPMTPPSGHYIKPRPQYFPPSPAFPLSRELATMEANENAAVPAPVPAPVPVVPGPVEQEATPAQRGPLPLPAVVFTVSRTRVSGHSEVFPLAGAHPCSLENKELTLPEAVRQLLGKVPPRVLYIALAPDQKSLWIYTGVGLERMVQEVGGSDEQTCANRRMLFSRLQPILANSDGVFSLPADLIDAVKLGQDAMLIGVRDHLELWDAKKWQEYGSEPNHQAKELLNTSDDLNAIQREWKRPWFTDQPSHMTPERVHGGIQ